MFGVSLGYFYASSLPGFCLGANSPKAGGGKALAQPAMRSASHPALPVVRDTLHPQVVRHTSQNPFNSR